ncbi:MAG: hypothetical protein Q9M46_06670 [Ghiorsea sp.]|nr:hypothetical protein [Ghiorsea sp.]
MASQWRQLTLSRQGLTSKQPFGSGVNSTLQAIKHLGYVQVDTLSVAERAHHHESVLPNQESVSRVLFA